MLANGSRRVVVLALAGLVGCASSPDHLSTSFVVDRGALSYQSAFLGERLWLATELSTRFELVVRRVDRRRVVELGRIDLGPSDWNTTGLAVAERGPVVWVSSLAGSVRSVDIEQMRVTRTWRVGSGATAVAASRSGALVAYGTSSGVICLRRARDGALLQCVAAHEGPVTALAFDGETLLSAGQAELRTWAMPSLRAVDRRSLGAPVAAMSPSPIGLALALGRPDPRRSVTAEVVVVAGGVSARCLGHRAAVASMAWSGTTLVTASIDGAIRLWDVALDGTARCSLRGERRLDQPVWSVASSPSGVHLAIGLWARELGQPSAVLAEVLAPQ